MINRVAATGLAVFLAAMSASCSDTTRQTCEVGGFSVAVPKGWTIDFDRRGNALTAYAPKGGGQATISFLTVASESAGKKDLNAYYKDQVVALSYFLDPITRQYVARKEFTEVESGDATIDGQAAKWIIYTLSLGGQAVQAIAYFVTDGTGRGFSFSGTCPASEFAKYRPIFEKSALSLKILPPAEKK